MVQHLSAGSWTLSLALATHAHLSGRWDARVQVHFGMSGAFKALSLPGREATPTTRLTLVNHDLNLVAHLSAMTVAHGDAGVSRTLPLCLRPVN